jgi:hypothetical protein
MRRQLTMRSRDQVNYERDYDYTCKILMNMQVNQLMPLITWNGILQRSIKVPRQAAASFYPGLLSDARLILLGSKVSSKLARMFQSVPTPTPIPSLPPDTTTYFYLYPQLYNSAPGTPPIPLHLRPVPSKHALLSSTPSSTYTWSPVTSTSTDSSNRSPLLVFPYKSLYH